MNSFAILRFRHCAIINRSLLEKCLWQYATCHAKLFSDGVNRNERRSIRAQERINRRKALKTRILNDIRETKCKVEQIIERENIWTIPNFLCIGRIVTSPFLSYLILSQDYQIALWILAAAGISDLADGWIARTWTSQASKLGSFLDPVADKLLVGTLFLTLAWAEMVPVPLTCLVVVRDVALVSAASYIRYRSLPPPKTLARYFDPTHATVQLAPTFISKINTVVQLSFIAGTLAAPVFHFVNHPFMEYLCYTTALTTLLGGLSYLISKNTYRLLKGKKPLSKPPR